MESSPNNIKQAIVDKQKFENYLDNMEKHNPKYKTKTFKDMFGYEIILFEGGEFELKGQFI